MRYGLSKSEVLVAKSSWATFTGSNSRNSAGKVGLPPSRPGTVIVADNLTHNGVVLEASPADDNARGARAFDVAVAAHPLLDSIIVPIVRRTIDGMSISVVK